MKKDDLNFFHFIETEYENYDANIAKNLPIWLWKKPWWEKDWEKQHYWLRPIQLELFTIKSNVYIANLQRFS